MGDLSSALNSAFDEATSTPETSSTASAPEAAPVETTSASETKTEAAPVEAPQEEPTGDVLMDKLTPEELAAVRADPKLRKVYAGLMKSYTPKMQEIAEGKKLLDAIHSSDPDIKRRAVEALARVVGLEIKPTDQPQRDKASEVADGISEEWAKVVGPEAAQMLRPLIEKTALAAVQGTIQPLQKSVERTEMEARARQSDAQISSFRTLAKEKGWTLNKDVESQMADIGNQIMPTRFNPVTGQHEIAPFETAEQGVKFLERCYRLATADTFEQDVEKRILERMSKNQADTEPARAVPSTGREKRSNITKEMSLNEALDVAMSEEMTR